MRRGFGNGWSYGLWGEMRRARRFRHLMHHRGWRRYGRGCSCCSLFALPLVLLPFVGVAFLIARSLA